jgi:FlaA1/EpsC-like NDP-sugar epimerase
LFRRQLAAGGPLTVTHPEVRRYFMTIPEAVQLVLQATALPEAAGRIALLEMGTQVRIVDLAEQLIRLAGLIPHKDVDIVFTGLRPGEKLEEELFGPDEQVVETSVDKIRLVERTSLPAEGLARRLRRLIQVAAGHDEVALRRVLSALAPEYQPPLHEFVLAAINGNGNGHGNGNGNGNGHRRGQRPPAARRSGATLALTLPARRVTGGAA